MIALAVDAAQSGRFLQPVNADKAFDENLGQFHEEAKFLYGDDERAILFAQMAFHELRRLPVHQFALSGVGATLRFRTLGRNLLEFDAAVGSESCGGRLTVWAIAGTHGVHRPLDERR